jgi:hypothetical protein
MKRTVLALSLLWVLTGTTPASAAFLGENPRLGESFPNTTLLRVSVDVNRELPPGSGGSCLERPAECFVAPAAPEGSPHAPGDVPDGYTIVKGGTQPPPEPGTTFSGSQGVDLYDASQGVPHGQVQPNTAGMIRSQGGQIEVAPELTRSGNMNYQHVNVTEGGTETTFGPPQPNPVPKSGRIQ